MRLLTFECNGRQRLGGELNGRIVDLQSSFALSVLTTIGFSADALERAERLLGARHQPLRLAALGEIGAQHHPGSAHLPERLPGRSLVAAVSDGDARPEPRHEQRGVAADAAARAGDECVLACESQHASHAIRGRRARQGTDCR
jgi:hypothetical protein